jgi:hypothetical protein
MSAPWATDVSPAEARVLTDARNLKKSGGSVTAVPAAGVDAATHRHRSHDYDRVGGLAGFATFDVWFTVARSGRQNALHPAGTLPERDFRPPDWPRVA